MDVEVKNTKGEQVFIHKNEKNDENTNDLQQYNESMEGNDDIDLIMANAVPAKPI